MRKENKHYSVKLILVLCLGVLVYIAFWKAPVSSERVEKTLTHEILKN